MADEVEGDVGQGQVLVDGRRAGDPLAQPLAEDEGVVAEAASGAGRGRNRRRAAARPAGSRVAPP
ncbi:hypothetical protein RKD35_006737 [Streptomyces albogriseolus]